MNANKSKGTKFESSIVGYLQWRFGTRDIERRALNGARDTGDIAGVKVHGKRLVIEAKNHNRHELARWIDEAETERGNDDALAGVVIFKRRGTTDPANQYALMTVRDLAALIDGQRR